jgi:hypothetical protein
MKSALHVMLSEAKRLACIVIKGLDSSRALRDQNDRSRAFFISALKHGCTFRPNRTVRVEK